MSGPVAAVGLFLASLNPSLTGLGSPQYFFFSNPAGESLISSMMVLSGLLFSYGAVLRWASGFELALATALGVIAGGVTLVVSLGIAYDQKSVIGGTTVVMYPNFPWGFLLIGWGVMAVLVLPLALISRRQIARATARFRANPRA